MCSGEWAQLVMCRRMVSDSAWALYPQARTDSHTQSSIGTHWEARNCEWHSGGPGVLRCRDTKAFAMAFRDDAHCFKHLDATQLIKHALGLRTIGRDITPKSRFCCTSLRSLDPGRTGAVCPLRISSATGPRSSDSLAWFATTKSCSNP